MAPVSTGPIVRQHFYLLAPDILWVHRRLHPRPAAAHLVLMGAQVLVVDPVTQIHLQFFNRSVNLAPECYLIELLLDGFVEALTDAIGLRQMHLGLVCSMLLMSRYSW